MEQYVKLIAQRIEQADAVLDAARTLPSDQGRGSLPAPLQYVVARKTALVEESAEVQRMMMKLELGWGTPSPSEAGGSDEGYEDVDDDEMPASTVGTADAGRSGGFSQLCSVIGTGDFCVASFQRN